MDKDTTISKTYSDGYTTGHSAGTMETIRECYALSMDKAVSISKTYSDGYITGRSDGTLETVRECYDLLIDNGEWSAADILMNKLITARLE